MAVPNPYVNASTHARFTFICPDGSSGLYEENRVVFAGEPMLFNTVGRPTASASGVWAVDPATDTLHVLSATMLAEVFVPTVEGLLTTEGRTRVSLTGLTFADMDFRSTGVQEGFNVADQSPG
jgi:hypothetical protein